jgi:hypothetical protein
MKNRRAFLALIPLGLVATAGAALAQPVPPPSYPPVPPPREELVPPPPGARYVWEPGHWHWNGVQYAWVPGHYILRHARYSHWVPGRWQWAPRQGRWVWQPSHWE